MTNAATVDDGKRTRRLVSISTIAGWFGVAPSTVHKWIDKGEDNALNWPQFPPADYEIPTVRCDAFVLAWEPGREPEIRAYKAEIDARPGRAWRKGVSGDTRYTTHQHIGKRPGRRRKEQQ